MFKHKKLVKPTPPQDPLREAVINSRNKENSPDRESERHSEVDNEDIILIDAENEEEEEEDAELAQMRRIDEEKSKAIQSVFRDLISQVNKMNEVLVPSPHVVAVNNQSPSKEQQMFQSPSKNNAGKENGSSLKKSIGKSNNKSSAPAKSNLSLTLGINNPQEGVLLAIFNMVMEIKSQNQYLVERQADLEYLVTQDLKPTLEDGLTKIRQDIRRLNTAGSRAQREAPKPVRRKPAAMTTKLGQNKRDQRTSQKFLQSENNFIIQPVVEQNVKEAPQTMAPSRPNIGSQLQMPTLENDCTFIRKLDQTELRAENQGSLEESKMEMSVGAHLIKIMQSNTASQNQAKPRARRGVLRNFNFKCNLDEIDKIIEEDVVLPSDVQLTENAHSPAVSQDKEKKEGQSEPPMQIVSDINSSIQQQEDQNQPMQSQEELKRPSTCRKKPRPVMGINNINFSKNTKESKTPRANENNENGIEAEVEKSEEQKTPNKRDAPSPLKVLEVQEVLKVIENATGAVRRIGTGIPNAFGGGQGIRIKRIPTSKTENEDPILALLRQEEEENKETETTSIQTNSVQQESQNEAITPRKARAMQIKRQAVGAAMFKAPPANLIESLLQEDSQVETPLTARVVDQNNVRVNNFMDKSPTRPGNERSPIQIRKVSPMLRRNPAAAKPTLNLGGICLDQSDDEITNSEKKKLTGDNPFNKVVVSKNSEDLQDNMRNLFFHQRSGLRDDSQSGATGDFGK